MSKPAANKIYYPVTSYCSSNENNDYKGRRTFVFNGIEHRKLLKKIFNNNFIPHSLKGGRPFLRVFMTSISARNVSERGKKVILRHSNYWRAA